MNQGILETTSMLFILVGTLVGFAGRWWLLRGDIRQYPTYPNGYLIHLTTGFIAAALGAVAYPALLGKNYVAVTFLALALQQFRDIRKAERESLLSLDNMEYAPRGDAYIDGIAKTFEARNYIVIISSLATTVSLFIMKPYVDSKLIIVGIGILIGFLVIYFLKNYTKGHSLKDIITIEEAPVKADGDNITVGDIFVMNIGSEPRRQRVLKNAIGLVLKPKGEREKIIINHQGQRRAIEHECARILGVERYIATRRNFKTGNVAMLIVPIDKDVSKLKEVIQSVPVLEINKKNSPEEEKNKNQG